MSLKIGSILGDRYRIVARIGHGGMAEVYEAVDIITRNTVAVKLIREDAMQNKQNLIRFENEASFAASLNHPNIVKVFDHSSSAERPYIINEYIKGQNLKETLDFRGRLSIKEAVSVMLQLTSALEYAHERGIIHRDIKPNNMYLMPDGSIKLADFGIAEIERPAITTATSSEIVGSVHYLAPEISTGKTASVLSDIYSAGVTFFELLTGHLPFTGETAINVAIAHIREKFPSPKKYLPECPKEIEKIIFKACEKDLNKRYQSCAEFYDDLLELEQHPELLKEKKNIFARIFGFK